MNILVIGSGAWGTTLAQVLCDNQNNVLIYAQDEETANEINNNHTNKKYLGEVLLNPKVKCTTNYDEFVKTADVILLSVPSAAIEPALSFLLPKLSKKYIFVNTIKGFVGENNSTVLKYLRKLIPSKYAYGFCSIIGPSYAEEVVRRYITTVDAVSKNRRIAKKVQKLFSNKYFRVYTNNDEIGSEIASAYKNAIAIGSGILFGMGFGQNGRAALITRGIHEMREFGIYFGGKSITYLGLTGIGDLVLTCNSTESRNFSFGKKIGETKDIDKVLNENFLTIEGYRTVKSLYVLSKQHKLRTPIVDALYKVLYEKADIIKTLYSLMDRPVGSEFKDLD